MLSFIRQISSLYYVKYGFPFFICRIYNITKEFPSKEKEKEKVKAVEGEDFVTVWFVFIEEYYVKSCILQYRMF